MISLYENVLNTSTKYVLKHVQSNQFNFEQWLRNLNTAPMSPIRYVVDLQRCRPQEEATIDTCEAQLLHSSEIPSSCEVLHSKLHKELIQKVDNNLRLLSELDAITAKCPWNPLTRVDVRNSRFIRMQPHCGYVCNGLRIVEKSSANITLPDILSLCCLEDHSKPKQIKLETLDTKNFAQYDKIGDERIR